MEETLSRPALYAPAAPAIAPSFNKSLYRPDEVVADYFKVLKWCFIPILAFTAVWLLEIYILHNPRRFVANPAELASRVFGFSHYLVGLIFMMSSRKMRKLQGWGWFVGLLGVGILISIFFHNFGGRANPILVIFYFLFFMVHGFRDVVFFYKPRTANRNLERTRSWILGLLQTCLLLALMYVLVPAYFFYRSLKPKTYWPELQNQINVLMPYLKAVLWVAWLMAPICIVAMWRQLQKFPGGLGGFYRDNQPILLVLLYSVLLILLSPVLGVWIYNLLILSHFVGWYFYASRRLASTPRQSARGEGLWKWFRGSTAGFQRLHLGIAAAFLILILFNYFFLTDRGILSMLFSANAFYYWTVIHVTISFAPRN
jgi:hypothetical protein